MRASRLLKKWKSYVLAPNYILDQEKYNASLMFNALKELNKEYVNFLYAKYYDTDKGAYGEIIEGIYNSYIPNSDKEMAEKFGVGVQEYTRKRIKIENEFMKRIERLKKEVYEKQVEKDEYFVLRLGKLYLKEYKVKNNYLKEVDPDMMLTQDGNKALCFKKGDPIASVLVRIIGFKKEKIKEEYHYHNLYEPWLYGYEYKLK